MLEKPLISIVTVSYNAVTTIEQTILSVINQSYSNIEYIVIDGGSTDGTVDIIKKYADKITYWVSEPDKGIYDAMNKGIRIATGDWINFMNSGDRFAQTEVLTLLFDYNFCLSSYGGIYGDAMFTQSDKPVGYFQNKPFWNLKYKFVGMGICHQSLFVRMDLAKSFLFNIKYKICADYDMCYKLYNSGYRFKYFPILISYFDRSGISSTDPYKGLKESAELTNTKYTLAFLLFYCFNMLRVRLALRNKLKKIGLIKNKQ